MQKLNICVHECYQESGGIISPFFMNDLFLRRRRLLTLLRRQIGEVDVLGAEEIAWSARTYPVLAILAPAMETNEGKIEYPGDPMCLYSALSVAIDQVVKVRKAGHLSEDISVDTNKYTYNDLCPQWGVLPTRAYRQQAQDSGIRDYTGPNLNTDQTIFDPRVWNESVKQYFIDQLLKKVRPKVVLISTVSPAHRYAIDIARQVRQYLPDTLIIFGGRHMDETMRYQDESKQLILEDSSTLKAIADERIDPVVDFIISGEGYFALDLLMKAISLAMDVEYRITTVRDVVEVLDNMAPLIGKLPGYAVLAARTEDGVHIFPLRGPAFDLAQLPSPYQAMAIRARFPIFRLEDDAVARTAHMMITSACPYRCNFCSESIAVVGGLRRFSRDPVSNAINRVLEYVSYGADAIFFDDSVFWSGNTKHMIEFSKKLIRIKTEAAKRTNDLSPLLQEQGDFERIIKLQWGAQLTAEFLTTIHSHSQILECLKTMKMAGCNYLYIGIESMASSIMNGIHKNLKKNSGFSWAEKIRQALMFAKEAGIRVGSSVLFGLDGETSETIEITIEGVGQIIDEGLLYLASPNILTYHPATLITRLHGKENQLDYHSLNNPPRVPYIYFEEAFPGVVSKELTEDDIWYIHRRTMERWGGGRYIDSLSEVFVLPN